MDGGLTVTSTDFDEGGLMPRRCTGFGEDISPAFHIEGLDAAAATLAVILDDLDVPFAGALCHWVIWNIPRTADIPSGIPAGETVPGLGGAAQGSAWGKHVYRGPKQPVVVRNTHRYLFSFYALDTSLALPPSAGKKELLEAMRGHIIQTGHITGLHRRGAN